MLGLVLLYFIGKAFYDLAKNYGRHQWGMAIAGLAVYFGSQFLTGIILGLTLGVDYDGNILGISVIALNLIGIAIGAVAAWAFYQYLKSSWARKEVVRDFDMLDEDLT